MRFLIAIDTLNHLDHSDETGLEGDGAAARASLAIIEEAKQRQGVGGPEIIAWVLVAAGSLPSALEPLRMARKLDPYRETARMAIDIIRRNRVICYSRQPK
jgi:hypothetical protein